MRPGAAPIAETSTREALQSRRSSHRRPLRAGAAGLLTALFWGLWLYLVLPLVTLLLWVAGIELVTREAVEANRTALLHTMSTYSVVLLVVLALLVAWIAWNVVRYGGARDRRTVKRPDVAPSDVWERFRVDHSIGETLQQTRFARVDFDREGCVTLLTLGSPPTAGLQP